jgi:RNA polymerase sigma-70 factor (ECF subfamily)
MAAAGEKQANWEALEERFSAYLRADAAATDGLFRDLTRVLRGYFRARVPSELEAQDLVQATLLKVHFSRDRYDPTRSLKTWVFTIASRTLIDHWRGLSTELADSRSGGEIDEDGGAVDPLEKVATPELGPALRAEFHGDLSSGFKKLKPIDRSIVYLYGVEEMSMKEISEILEITEASAKVRAHRAYKVLRKHLLVSVVLFLLGGRG